MTLDQLAQIAIYANRGVLTMFLPMLNATMAKYQIDTPLRMAHFIGQLILESGSFRYTAEQDTGAAYEGRADLGNTHKGDGPLYKGRGFIQLTGRANYAAYSKAVNEDLLTNPTDVATKYPADVAGWFWQQHGINALADQDNVMAVTRMINGGYNGLADRTFYTNKAKSVLLPQAV